MTRYISILIPLSMLACNNDTSDTSTAEAIVDDGSTWAKSYVENLNDQVYTNPELSELNRLEDAVIEAQTQIIKPWITAWYNKDAAAFQNILQSREAGLQWTTAQLEEINQKDGIILSEVNVASGYDMTEDYLSTFTKVENIQIDVNHIELPQDDKGTLSLRYDRHDLRLSD